MPLAGESYAGLVDGCYIGPPNIGLSPDQTQDLFRQAQERIAAENEAKAKAKAEAKERKAAKQGKLHRGQTGSNSNGDQNQAGRWCCAEVFICVDEVWLTCLS